MRRYWRSGVLVLTLGVALVASAAAAAETVTLRTPEGLEVTVATVQSFGASLGGRLAGSSPLASGLAYQVADDRGRIHRGIVPGTEQLRGDLHPVLRRHPVSGEVLLLFVAPHASSPDAPTELAFTSWTGQAWLDWRPLSHADAHEGAPALTFRASGDAVLAWCRRETGQDRLLLRHLELHAAGETHVHAFVDLGAPDAYLGPPSSEDAGDPRVSVVPDPVDGKVFIVLDDPAGERLSVLAVEIGILDGGDGIGASPVPVTLRAGDRPDGRPDGEEPTLDGGPAGGDVLEPVRLVLPEGEAVYWVEPAKVRAIVLDEPGHERIVDVTRPFVAEEIPFAIARAVRRELLSRGALAEGTRDRRAGERATRRAR